MTEETTTLLNLKDNLKEIKEQQDNQKERQDQIKEQQSNIEARLTTMENSMKHMEEIMNKLVRAAKTGGIKTKGNGGTKMKNGKVQMPTIEDVESTAEDWVLWPARAIGCCN
ncbi:unnamed protein product [Vicia faba]|uniref:Uncharacterized protein n=1 Tax=Vicia faba TaxID=3906 RepID=A0AAV1B8S7_VICFA|nr:unnamed protein product [Vicia faba]